MNEPRDFFIPFGTYSKEEDRQLYVSTDERDPLVTTPWFLVDQKVREDMLDRMVKDGFEPPEFGFKDAQLKDDMGTDIVDLNDEDIISRWPIIPPESKESNRIGSGMFRPAKAEISAPFMFLAKGNESWIKIDLADITGTKDEDHPGRLNKEWETWLTDHCQLVCYNLWPKNGSKTWDTLLLNAYSMLKKGRDHNPQD